MALTKKQKYSIGFGIIAIIILIVLFWDKIFPKKETCADGSKIPSNGICPTIVQNSTGQYINQQTGKPVSNYTPVTPSGCVKPTSYIPESFPIAKGMKGPKVGQIQKEVGVYKDDYFGCITEDAVIKKFGGSKDISQTQYDDLIG